MTDEIQITSGEPPAEPAQHASSRPTFAPQVDIIEKPDAVVILADIPGVTKDRVEVVLERGVLTIRADATGGDQEGMSLDLAEYEAGDFYRSFTVGRGLDATNVEGAVKDGVLRLVIPKSAQYKPRRIEVRGG